MHSSSDYWWYPTKWPDDSRVDIWKKISEFSPDQGISIVNTDKLKAFIDKYGVDYNGHWEDYLLRHLHSMTRDQVDIVFQYKPDFSRVFKDDMWNDYFSSEIATYIVSKLLEKDHQFLLLQRTISLYDKSNGWGDYTLSELAELEEQNFRIDDESFLIIKTLIKNHQKKYYSLFDLLKQKLLK